MTGTTSRSEERSVANTVEVRGPTLVSARLNKEKKEMIARSNHLRVLAFALAAIVAVCLLALVAAEKPAEATFPAVTGNNPVLPSQRVELVNPILGKSPPEIYVMSAHSTERTNPINKFGKDSHAVVVARWHKDSLHLRKLAQQ